MTRTLTHEIPNEKELSFSYQNTTMLGTSTYHPTIDWVEPNISFNQSALNHIPIMNVGSHGKLRTPNQGFQRPNCLNPQPVIPPHNQTSLTINRSFSTQVV